MGFRTLSPLEVTRMMELADKPYRPAVIIELKYRIENETKAAELKASITGVIDPEDVQRIVAMKLELDVLYGKWTVGELE
jgi:hypothetical protein